MNGSATPQGQAAGDGNLRFDQHAPGRPVYNGKRLPRARRQAHKNGETILEILTGLEKTKISLAMFLSVGDDVVFETLSGEKMIDGVREMVVAIWWA